jgi:hypothetical protein
VGGLALKIKDLDEDALASSGSQNFGSPTKECSGCDPDVPGHEERATCSVCKGTGRESLSFAAAYAEVCESRRAEESGKRGLGGDLEYGDDDDTPSDLDY